MRDDNDYPRRVAPGLQARTVSVRSGLFDIEHASRSRRPRQQMLWPLIDKIPPEMRETDQVFGLGCDLTSRGVADVESIHI
jgi:hypothetical protein